MAPWDKLPGLLPQSPLMEAARAGKRLAFAPAPYFLVHAGTVDFLNQLACRAEFITALILPMPPFQNAALTQLLRLDERRRVLAALEPVGEALLLPDEPEVLGEWKNAFPEALWAWDNGETGLDAGPWKKALPALQALERKGFDCHCGELLQRMSR